VAVVAVPFASQAVVHRLGVDVMDSDVDPLCGVLNRRAFYSRACQLIAAHHHAAYLTVTMVDLDNFKHVNDTYGHAVGDRALMAVADVLRHSSDDSAVIARVGGEEFLIAEVIADRHAATRAERLRRAIASTPFDITASVGIASTSLRPSAVLGREIIDALIGTADGAMYDAKRNGGNQIHHRQLIEHPTDDA
jgi:diguanylate cyclase (GGDEF)-like protein